MFWSFGNLESNMVHILRAFLSGFLYDLAVGISFLMLYALYLLVFPKRWIGLAVDKTFTYGYLGLMLFIMFFSLMAEFPFWDEFGARFNFIAVDYLIYTYEVVANINQSYPLPLIIAALVLLDALSFFML